jgi:hypothetical protein
MKGKWGTGIKLALAALGVIIISTALKSFISYQRSPGKDALFTIGAALLLGFGARAFGAGGIASAALTSGLVVAGVEFVGGQASQIGQSLANSFRGITGQGGTPMPTTPQGAQPQGYFSYGQGGGVPLGMGLMPSQGGAPIQGVAPVQQPTAASPQQVSIVYEAAERPSDLAVIASEGLKAVGSFFEGGFGKILGGSAGIDDFVDALPRGSGANQRVDRLQSLLT